MMIVGDPNVGVVSWNLLGENPIQTLRWSKLTTFDRQGINVQRKWFRICTNKETCNMCAATFSVDAIALVGQITSSFFVESKYVDTSSNQ